VRGLKRNSHYGQPDEKIAKKPKEEPAKFKHQVRKSPLIPRRAIKYA
jgi:hypothetical protein